MSYIVDVEWSFFQFASILNGDAFGFMDSNNGIYTWVWAGPGSHRRVFYVGQTNKSFLNRAFAHFEYQLALKYYIHDVPQGIDFYDYMKLNFCGKPTSEIGHGSLIHYKGNDRINMLSLEVYAKNIKYLSNCMFGFGVIEPAADHDIKDYYMAVEGKLLQSVNSYFEKQTGMAARYAGARSNDTFFGKISRTPPADMELRHSLSKDSSEPLPPDFASF
jgi:hypothetical protein